MSQPGIWRENTSHGGQIQWVDGPHGPLPSSSVAILGPLWCIICKSTPSNWLLCCEVGCNFVQVGFLPRTSLFVLFCSQFSIFLSYDSTPIFLNADLSELRCPPWSHLLNPNVCSYSLTRSSRKVLCSGSFCPIKQRIYGTLFKCGFLLTHSQTPGLLQLCVNIGAWLFVLLAVTGLICAYISVFVCLFISSLITTLTYPVWWTFPLLT